MRNMKNNSDLFYVCSLIEFIGRRQKQRRKDVVRFLGRETVKRIYRYADIFHCEPIEKVADDFITLCNIPVGEWDTSEEIKKVDYWDLGKVYQQLVEDISENEDIEVVVNSIMEILSSPVSDDLSFCRGFYNRPREEIFKMYMKYEEEKATEKEPREDLVLGLRQNVYGEELGISIVRDKETEKLKLIVSKDGEKAECATFKDEGSAAVFMGVVRKMADMNW